jgi:hypothetical protein
MARLEKLHLIERHGDTVSPLPVLARFALGEADVRTPGVKRVAPQLSVEPEFELT